MRLYNLYRRFCRALTAAAFAEAGEHETARTLLGRESQAVQRPDRALVGKTVATG